MTISLGDGDSSIGVGSGSRMSPSMLGTSSEWDMVSDAILSEWRSRWRERGMSRLGPQASSPPGAQVLKTGAGHGGRAYQ